MPSVKQAGEEEYPDYFRKTNSTVYSKKLTVLGIFIGGTPEKGLLEDSNQ